MAIKKYWKWIAAALLVLVLMWSSKPMVFLRVRMDAPKLTAMAEDILEAGTAEGFAYRDHRIQYEFRDVVEVQTGGWGLVPASTYVGFYYSPTDEPLNLMSDEALTSEGRAWTWQQQGGDNRFQTERITEHWFWFEERY